MSVVRLRVVQFFFPINCFAQQYSNNDKTNGNLGYYQGEIIRGITHALNCQPKN